MEDSKKIRPDRRKWYKTVRKDTSPKIVQEKAKSRRLRRTSNGDNTAQKKYHPSLRT